MKSIMKTMKAVLLALACAGAVQAREIAPLLAEGKSWVMVESRKEMRTGIKYNKYYRIDCVDKAIDEDGVGVYALKGYYIGQGEYGLGDYTLREKDGLVTWGSIPIVDFRAAKGDEFERYDSRNKPVGGFIKIVDEGETIVNMKPARELFVGWRYDDGALPPGSENAGDAYFPQAWVEGVGAQSDNMWIYEREGMISHDVAFCSDIVACYQDGVKIFGREDFANPQPLIERPALLTEGKEWLFEETEPSVSVDADAARRLFTVKMAGDTVVGGIEAKCLVKQYVGEAEPCEVYVAREEYGITSVMVEDAADGGSPLFRPVVNFNTTLTDSLPVCGRYDGVDAAPKRMLYAVDAHEFMVDGSESREITMQGWSVESQKICWVEGVGSSTGGGLLDLEPESRSGSAVSMRMLECRVDGRVIFTAEDFTYPAIASIAETAAAGGEGGRELYDLQGRRLAAPVRGSLYVGNGRLQLAR